MNKKESVDLNIKKIFLTEDEEDVRTVLRCTYQDGCDHVLEVAKKILPDEIYTTLNLALKGVAVEQINNSINS